MASLFDNLVIDKQVIIEQEYTIEGYGKQYAVILHNDDKTPFQFVIYALIEIFGKTVEEASNLALKIHNSTKGTVGIYDKDTAYDKVDELDKLKKEFRYPLLATVEEVE